MSGIKITYNEKGEMVEKIKTIVFEMVHNSDTTSITKFSIYISQRIGYNYTFLSKIFSEKMGMNIKSYIKAYKIERVKEYLLKDELNADEIAYKLHFSNAVYMNRQFKSETGFTTVCFKQLMKYKNEMKLKP